MLLITYHKQIMVQIEVNETTKHYDDDGIVSYGMGFFVILGSGLKIYFYTSNIEDAIYHGRCLVHENNTGQMFYNNFLNCFRYTLTTNSENKIILNKITNKSENKHNSLECPTSLYEMYITTIFLLEELRSHYKKQKDNDCDEWQQYLSPKDYQTLNSFVNDAKLGLKTKTVLVVCGTGYNGTTSLINRIIKTIGTNKCCFKSLCNNVKAGHKDLELSNTDRYPHLFYNEESHKTIDETVIEKLVSGQDLKKQRLYEKDRIYSAENGHGASLVISVNDLNELPNVVCDFEYKIITLVKNKSVHM